MYALASPDFPPSWYSSRRSSVQNIAGSTATPSHMPPCSPYDTGHPPIYVSLKPTASANTIASSLLNDAAYYSDTEGGHSFHSRREAQLLGGSSSSLRPSRSSSQVSRAPVSPPRGGKPSLASKDSCLQTGQRVSWEPVQYVEPDICLNIGHRPAIAGRSSSRPSRRRAYWETIQYQEPNSSDLVRSASSDSSRSASFSSSHSNRIKKNQQNPTSFCERWRTTGRGFLSRITGATPSVSGTTHNNLYRRFVKW